MFETFSLKCITDCITYSVVYKIKNNNTHYSIINIAKKICQKVNNINEIY